MIAEESMSPDAIRVFCTQLLLENEKAGGSPQETVALHRRVNALLGALGDRMPFLSCRDEFIEFDLFQEETTEKMLTIEKELYLHGNEGGLIMFLEALREFFQLKIEALLEMESQGATFFETFRNDYLLKYAEFLFEEALKVLQDPVFPTHPNKLLNVRGICYRNKLYDLYTFLYEDATKERKRKIQSLMQKQGVTVKDLKKYSHMK